MNATVERKFMLKKSEHDKEELKLSNMLLNRAVDLPKQFDLRENKKIEIKNQGKLGSCGAMALTTLREFLLEDEDIKLSPSFLYYETRKRNGEENEDFGISIGEGIKTLLNIGVSEEQYMPYTDEIYNVAPSKESYENAKKYKIKSYINLDQGIKGIMNWLYLKQTPVVFGMPVSEQFTQINKTGIVNTPNKEDLNLGEHACVILGWKQNDWKANIKSKINKKYSKHGYFLCANSFGTQWGNNGYFWLSFEHILENIAYDFYVITV